jgi:hydrogenase/urease accessory protein HupE
MNRRWLPMAALALFLAPGLAQAHLVTTGMGPVYDGIGHLLLSPEDLVAVLGLSLYAGLRGAVAGRRTMFLLPLAWFAAGLAGSMVHSVPALPAPALSFLVLGLFVAADLRLPANAVAVLAALIGLVHGFFNGAALKQGTGTVGLLGIMVMLFVLVALASALVVSLKRPWTRIAVRVLGSWIAASGLLLLGWSLASRQAPNPGPSGWLRSAPAFVELGTCRPVPSAASPHPG